MSDIDKGTSAAQWPPCDQDEAEALIWFVEYTTGYGPEESDPMTWDEATNLADQLLTRYGEDRVTYVISRVQHPDD